MLGPRGISRKATSASTWLQVRDGVDPRAANGGLPGQSQAEDVAIEANHLWHVVNDQIDVIDAFNHGASLVDQPPDWYPILTHSLRPVGRF